MTSATSRKILVSGASIAGPAMAYWLNRYGFDVTVVERAPTVRLGGYPIDIRGSAISVVERMGLLPILRDAHIRTGSISFLDDDGSAMKVVPPEEVSGGTEGFDVEIPRWTLSTLLYDASNGAADYRFGESIAHIDDRPDAAIVTFESGKQEAFDLVIGTDGLHSNTRRLAFGAKEQFLTYMGYTFIGFTMPNFLGMSHGAAIRPAIGRMAALYAVRDSEMIHAFFNVVRDFPSEAELTSIDVQRALFREIYREDAGIVPEMLKALDTADDVYFDAVSQVHMPRWGKGRVAVIGDAAYAPSFLTGQGSSLALVGAYVLAGELASHENHEDSFEAYERIVRGFIETNQRLASFRGSQFVPNSQAEYDGLISRLGTIQVSGDDAYAQERRLAHNSLELPDYSGLEMVT
jgi:2-polyprenyl-6-methoxyphenol hydroxylase-like FAD-dependent oxidoreductase